MQALITIPVIDTFSVMAQRAEMLTHDQILNELIKQIVNKQIKQVDVASRLGIPPSRVAEMRKRERRIQPHEMPVLAALLEMASNDQPRLASIKGVSRIPILGKVAAGLWLDESLTAQEASDFVAFDNLAGETDTSGLFAVTTEGDSMNLAFPANAVLICRHVRDGFATIRAGDYVIVERENHDLREMTCKRIEIDRDGNFMLVSESTNPKHLEPMVIPRSTDDEHTDVGVNVLGKLVRVVVDYERR